MTPTLYDVLGVSPDASRDEIRAAWRAAADRFEPGEGGAARFRLFNEAAEVLLDPARRAEYDARLVETDPAAPPEQSVAATRARAGGRRPARRTGWLLPAALGVLAALVTGAAVYLTLEANRAAAYLEALDRAPSAAENAAIAVLSYDHESLEVDRDAAAKFLSPGYRDDYVTTFDELVVDNARQTRASVEAEVLASSAMTVSERRDPDRVNVLLFVNQTSTSTATGGDPSVALNRVQLEMVRVDGAWLVDHITSY
jgi:Mce-associated membrane protein